MIPNGGCRTKPLAEPIVVTGLLGQMEFDGEFVTIVKNGYGPRMKGQRPVALAQIARIVVKPATHLKHGYIQVVVEDQPSAPELRGLLLGGRTHMEDPLSMSFRHGTNAEIGRLRDAIEAAIRRQQVTRS